MAARPASSATRAKPADADGKRATVTGTFQCVGGTGRFDGLKGEGTYRGERLGALRTGDFVYVDTTGSCILP